MSWRTEESPASRTSILKRPLDVSFLAAGHFVQAIHNNHHRTGAGEALFVIREISFRFHVTYHRLSGPMVCSALAFSMRKVPVSAVVFTGVFIAGKQRLVKLFA